MLTALISLGSIPGNGIAGQRVGVCLTSLETSEQFCKVAVPLVSHQRSLVFPKFLIFCIQRPWSHPYWARHSHLLSLFLSLSPGAQEISKQNVDLVSLPVAWGQLPWLWALLLYMSQVLPSAAVSGTQGTEPSWREVPGPLQLPDAGAALPGAGCPSFPALPLSVKSGVRPHVRRPSESAVGPSHSLSFTVFVV